MEEVIRVREIRKSMEQSGHFFTPVCSPMDAPTPNGVTPGGPLPSSTPRNFDLYMTLDCTPEDEPLRRKKSSGGRASNSSTPTTRVLRNRAHESVLLDDSVSTSFNSSSTADLSATTTPEQNQRRTVFRREYFFCFDVLPCVYLILILIIQINIVSLKCPRHPLRHHPESWVFQQFNVNLTHFDRANLRLLD